ncbi:MAG: polyphosphate kinase 2 family protein [Elusimicrobia bacterium]|nr:polyphosphate kinase 2 family protein [Elusimicrobiota bacterium]
MKLALALLAALPVQAQFRSAPVKAPVLTPVLAVPGMLAPTLSGPALAAPALLAPSLPSASALPVLPAAAIPAAAPRAAAATAAPAAGAAFAAPTAQAVSAAKEAAPKAERGEKAGSAEAAARLNTLFDGAGKLASDLRAPPAAVDLSAIPSDATPRAKSEKKAAKRLEKDLARIQKYQEMLFARGERAVLLVFQGMDTGGKDGVIKTVVGAINPQGVKVTSFKKPTAAEQRHHYLWRIKKALPGPGGTGVLNRSHYEDIVVPSVLGTHKPEVIELRYDEVNAFEKALAEKGVLILKFFMHISKDEQKRRLQARLDEPDKNWKFSPADLKSREKWDDYHRAWGKVMSRTNTPWAPWFVIPADNKWYRDYAVARILRKAMDRLGLSYPPGPEHPEKIVIPD